MLGWTLKGVIAESKIDPKLIEDVAVGTVLAPGGGSTQARMGALWAGIPNTAGCNSLNRQCSSGLAAVNQIANQIALGQIDIGIGSGVESMTLNYGAGVMPAKMSDAVMENEEATSHLRAFAVSLLEAPAFAQEVRARILAGRPGADRPDPGALVCSCFGVGADDIRRAVGGGCSSVAAIGQSLRAGTNCGSCRTEIQGLIDAERRVLEPS